MSGQDPMANIQTLWGWGGLANPNPYLKYTGAIPMAGYYTGDAGDLPPTDATGKPIQSFVDYNKGAQADYQKALAAYNAQGSTPGTTLNTPAAANRATGANADQPPLGFPIGTQNATLQQGFNQAMLGATGGPDPMGSRIQANILQRAIGGDPMYQQWAQNLGYGGAQQDSRGPPPSPPDLRQAYLTALANPGPVNTYGAAPPQPGQTLTGSVQQPSVIQAFLDAHPTATTGAGGYSNQGFLDTLRKLA